MVMQILAGMVAVLCVVMLARLLLRPHQRRRFDASIQNMWQRLSYRARVAWHGMKHWRARRQAKHAAATQAQDLINRMRIRSVVREGNVYKPEAFSRPPEDHRKH